MTVQVQMLFDATKSDLLELELETNNSKPNLDRIDLPPKP